MMNVVRLPDRRPELDPRAAVIARWLRETSAAAGLSFEAWGKRAGVSPTTMTRFLTHGRPVIKQSTLTLLAQSVGAQAPSLLASTDLQPLVDIPVILPDIWRRSGKATAMLASVQATKVLPKHAACVGVRVTTNSATFAGVLPADLVVVDPEREIADNALVAVALETGECGVYRVVGDRLVAPAAGNFPTLRRSEVEIIGTVVQVQRDL